MGTEPIVESQTGSYRYEAIVRISETIAACREPEEMATTLASEIGKFLHFDHLYFVVLKENSTGNRIPSVGQEPNPYAGPADARTGDVGRDQQPRPQHTPDWDAEERFPRFREYAKKMRLGSSIRVPLITPHRPLGVLGIIRDTVNPFSEEEISFLGLIGRVVAFALDDGLNLRRAQHQNDQLQLLLNLTNRITSILNFGTCCAPLRRTYAKSYMRRCHRLVARCSLGEIQGIRHRFPAWKRGPQGRGAR